MTNHKLSEDDAAALIAGTAPSEHPELASLAASLADLRAARQPAPQPSAALIARIDLGIRPAIAPVVNKRRRTLTSWFVGLGILAKLALGALLAVTAVSGAGAAGILPGAAQRTFDHIVNIVVHPSIEIKQSPIGTPGADDSTTPPASGPGVTTPAQPGDDVGDDNGVDPVDDTPGEPVPTPPGPTPGAPGTAGPGPAAPGAPAPGTPGPGTPPSNSGPGNSGPGNSGPGNSGHGNSGNSGPGNSGHGKPGKPGKDSNDNSGSGSGSGSGTSSGPGKSGGKGSGKD